MVRTWKHRWGLSPSLRPWEAWTVLMKVCGRSRPVGSPRSSCDAYVRRVCHCHCAGDRCSCHPVCLVWVKGSFGCRTITARTWDLILYTLPAFTSIYRGYLSVFGNLIYLCGIIPVCLPNWSHVVILTPVGAWGGNPPSKGVLGTRPMLWCDQAARWFALRRGVKRYPGPHGL